MKRNLKSPQLIPLSFLGAIIIGTILLMLPVSTSDGNGGGVLTSLFTATTSICVTGLVVVDSYAYWSLFGKIVILILIQIGGLGIITVTSVFMLLIHRRFSLSQTVLIHDAFNLDSIHGLRKFFGRVFRGTLLVEGIGSLFYMPVFIPQFGALRGIWISVFTSISAFCNAGIDIIGPNSLIDYNSNPLVLINTMMLIIMGGLGYVVWFDIGRGLRKGVRRKYDVATVVKRFSEHTKLVLLITAFLIGSGAIIVFVSEYSNPDTIGNMSLPCKILNSIFQSVTFRTAGFASVPQQNLTDVTSVIGSVYMFIGGSPVGTAGGVKTVTVFMVVANTIAYIRSRKETVVFGRRIPQEDISKSSAIICVSLAITIILMCLLLATNGISLVDGMYETFSATATVGLSRALTPTLNRAGRLIIIVGMYLGRIGPISMALYFSKSTNEKNHIRYVKGNFYAG